MTIEWENPGPPPQGFIAFTQETWDRLKELGGVTIDGLMLFKIGGGVMLMDKHNPDAMRVAEALTPTGVPEE